MCTKSLEQSLFLEYISQASSQNFRRYGRRYAVSWILHETDSNTSWRLNWITLLNLYRGVTYSKNRSLFKSQFLSTKKTQRPPMFSLWCEITNIFVPFQVTGVFFLKNNQQHYFFRIVQLYLSIPLSQQINAIFVLPKM